MHPGAGEQERKTGGRDADHERVGPRDQDEGEGHDREAAELAERAEPDIGHPPPAEDGPVGVGTIADQRPERRNQQGDGDHQRDDPGRRIQFDDQHAVERAVEQHRGKTDADLEQGQPQQTPEGKLGTGRIRKGQEPRSHGLPEGHCGWPFVHARLIPMAWDL